MSGGHYDYAYFKAEDFSDHIELEDLCDYSARELRVAFKQHLLDVANAMKAIEWNDSGDGDPDEQVLIRKCLTGRSLP